MKALLFLGGNYSAVHACREEFGLKAQVICLHLQSKKHATGKERLKKTLKNNNYGVLL